MEDHGGQGQNENGSSKASKGKRAAPGTVSQGKKTSATSKKKVTMDVQVPEEDEEQKDEMGKEAMEGGEALVTGKGRNSGKEEEDEDEEEEEERNLDLDLSKFPTMTAEKMQAVLEKFTPEQMSRYECYRRSGFQRSTMKRFLQTVAGSVVTVHMAIVMSGITKIFVGELVETARVVMSERGDRGPIRPSHMRESYRRLKQQGKVPLKRRPNFFR